MYDRHISLDPAHPEKQLPTLVVGLMSAATIHLDGIPTGVSSVQVIFTTPKYRTPYSYSATASSGVWSVAVAGGFFTETGAWRYEVNLTTDAGRFWSSSGCVQVVKATTQGIVPEPVDPSQGRNLVLSVNSQIPDEHGNVVVPTDDTDAIRYTRQTLTDSQKTLARQNIGAVSSADIPSVPVQSVNNKTGAVSLNASDVGALPITGGTLTDELTIANGGGSTSYGIGYIRGDGNDTVFELPPDDGERKTLATTDQIPTVDTTLNPSSTNPLANSAVAASLPMNLRWANAEMSEDDGWYVIHAKNHDIVNVIMTPNMISQSVDNTIDIRVPVMSYNPTSATNCGYEGMIRLTLAGTLTDQPVLLFEDENFMGSFFLMEGSVTEFVGGKSYLILIFAKPTNASANHGVYNIKIVEDGSVAV